MELVDDQYEENKGKEQLADLRKRILEKANSIMGITILFQDLGEKCDSGDLSIMADNLLGEAELLAKMSEDYFETEVSHGGG
jgi:hypothetical protein